MKKQSRNSNFKYSLKNKKNKRKINSSLKYAKANHKTRLKCKLVYLQKYHIITQRKSACSKLSLKPTATQSHLERRLH